MSDVPSYSELNAALAATRENRDMLREALRVEKERNLLDRKLILFLNAVQTWLNGACAQHLITPCRAAEIQLQAACVPPSVLGSISVPPFSIKHKDDTQPTANADSLAWQACNFCKHFNETNSWPMWTDLGAI